MTLVRNTRRWWIVAAAACCLSVSVGLVFARPLATEYRLWRARREIADRSPQAALHWLSAARRSAPDRGEVYYLMARAQRRLEAYDKAIEQLRQAHQLGFPTDALDREQLMAMVEAGQIALDDPRLQELVANPGGDAREIYESLVKGYYRLFEIGPAVLALEAWEETFPADPQPRVYRGLLAEYEENWPEAARWFRRAAELAPQRRDIRLHLARAERKQHRYREAMLHYGFALEIERDVEALHGWAKCLWARGNLQQARQAFSEALQIDPNHYDSLLALGELDVEAGNGAEALRWLEPAAKQKPREYDAHYALGLALLFSGQGEQAMPHFQFASQSRLALTRVGILRRQVAKQPDNAELRFQIGQALLQYGEPADALRWLGSVLQYQPDHRGAHTALADFYAAQGDAEAAAEHRRQLSQDK